ncbi:MAG TPA: AMP-binding protein, partial [Corynebacterium sp.]|nr:AMP-binding protein [Corynebacterium sp.]
MKLSDPVPASYLRGPEAPPPRTLYDVLAATAAAHPEAAALDDGSDILTYADLMESVHAQAEEMHANGLRRGDRVGIRMTSGHKELYLAILAVIAAGAAYVPVDADDPEERAELVFSEAGIHAIYTDEGFRMLTHRPGDGPAEVQRPHLDDDAWIIFTSGSTGKPKGVAVSNR